MADVPARTRSAVLWGLVGALAFGVLYQGYALVGAEWEWVVLVAGMVAVGAVTAVLAYRFEARLGVGGS